MNRIQKLVLAATVLCVAALPVAAFATPNINGTVVIPRVFNDCPGSILTYSNTPTDVVITDSNPNCLGFANLHNWRLSDDGGAGAARFTNGDSFRYCFDMVISGTGAGEAGANIAPWWSNTDGRLNFRTTDGEIAAFGGRLPFFSFTAAFGITYILGTPVHVEIIYLPNLLSQANPATIEYRLVYFGTPYSSGPLAFDQGNPAEDPPHGQWGILTPAQVGGHFQYFLGQSGPGTTLQAEFRGICYEPLEVIPTLPTTWGNIKALYND